MKSKISKILSILLCLIISLSIAPTAYAGGDNRGNEYFNHILSYKKGSQSVQGFIDNTLCSEAGYGSEWYVLSLIQNEKYSGKKYNYKNFESSLIAYTKRVKHINPVAKQRIALCLMSIGSTDSFISDALNNTISKQGIMSYIFGLHMLNNGYNSTSTNKQNVTDTLIGLQKSNGGWALFGDSTDTDVTAMAIQCLAPQYRSNANAKASIDKALGYLSAKQNADGSFSAINGNAMVETSESTSQVILALASLNIDAKSDSRFIKNGKNLFDALSLFKLSQGFSHIVGGEVNEIANQQVFYSMVAYNRMGNLYILDKARPNDIDSTNGSQNNSPNANNNANGKNNSQIVNNGPSTNSQAITNQDNQSNIATQEDTSETTNSTISESTQETTNVAEDGTTTLESSNQSVENSNTTDENSNYKVWVILVLIIICAIVCLILHLTKKDNKGNYLIVLAISTILILLVALTNVKSVDNYKNGIIANTSTNQSVSISISCDTIKDKTDNEYISSDGIILETTNIEISDGDTVYDVLNKACVNGNIAIETNGTDDSIYIEGINYIYELDYGDLSGWMYYVNGQEPSVSCGSYKVKDCDTIEWKYTTNLGEDLK